MAKPVLCLYYLTYRCNARCSFCDIYQRSTKNAETAKVKNHLKQLADMDVRYIDFTGGEPLLHPDLPELLKYAGELGLHTSVTTNCILYPKRAGEIRGLVDFLHFSLDAADPQIHDGIRGVKCFAKVMESIDLARNLGERPDILMTVTPQNYNQIEPVLKIASENKLMLILNPVFDYLNGSNPDRKLAERMMNLPRKKYLYNNTAFLKMMLDGGNDPDNPRCRAVSSSIVISPEGNQMLPCYHKSAVEIDLSEGLVEVRKTKAFRSALQKQGRYNFCHGCTINCYFDPSFLYKPDSLFIRSLMAKAKYAYDKFLTS